jgi:acetolactate synthase I/III small subunit
MIRHICLTVYSDNNPGLLHRVTAVFTRRKLNIESLTVSETQFPGISRYTIVAAMDREYAERIAEQIRKIIEVHDVFVGDEEAMISREVALIKLRHQNRSDHSKVVGEHQLVLVATSVDAIIYEKTGSVEEVSDALFALRPYGILEFARSGRISMHSLGSGWGATVEVGARAF